MVMEAAEGPTKADLTGLNETEVAERTARGLVNTVPEGPSRTVKEIIRVNVVTRFNILLGALLVLVLFVAPLADALFGIVLIVNTLIGVIQELRAKRTLDQLALLHAPRALVVRSGREVEVPVGTVVLDDVLALRSGDQVVVDGEVLASDGLEIDESLLTGESEPVLKEPGEEILSGSFVSSGSGHYRARRIGEDAYAVRLAQEARKFTLVRSELRRGIDWILAAISWAIVPTIILLVWSQVGANTSIKEALRASIAGMVAMVPQGLVLLTSIAFAVGVIRLGRKQVLVQELPAVEGLARVDTVCFDKTGTLTEGRLAVEDLALLDDGAEPAAALGALAAADPRPNTTLQAIADAFPLPRGWSPTTTVPFSSARKWSGASFGSLGSWVLGAPEVVLPDDPTVTQRAEAFAVEGKRVLLLGHSRNELDGDRLPSDLRPIALVTLADRIRPDAAETLKFFYQQGVAAKVLSGDHPRTVSAIAQKVGIPGAEKPVDARHLPEDRAELTRAIEESTVFGRVTPHQKRAMVGALQAGGHVVAMTGDGVNDVLALKDADIGIAMGSGSSASRAVAQLVLLDASFETLPSVVGEGRRVIGNIERVANLFVTKTVYAFLLAVLVGLFARPFPFVPRHLTLVGTLTIGAPAFALALAKSARRARPGFVKHVLRFALPTGALAAAATYAAYELAIVEDVTLTEARTTATLVLVAIGLFALTVNSRPLTSWRKALIGSMGLIFLIVLFSAGLRSFFELDLPRAVVLFAAVGIVALTGAVMYGALRALGWLQRFPDILRTPWQDYRPWQAVNVWVSRLRQKRGVIDPKMPQEEQPERPADE
ncbi:MAG: HAD-IC family P-type ATPase [Acidimicrobiia bacterium]